MKMKFQVPKLLKRKKLRATAVRRPLRIAAATEYDEMAEPNMKLSRALLIVLVLHVVAISGIIAFNAIKTHQGPAPVPVSPANNSNPAVGSTVKPESVSHSAAAKEIPRAEAKAALPTAKAVTKEDRKTDRPKAHEPTKAGDSGNTYVVVKGDNPVSIAKKLNVSYDALISLNHISDPRKLQIGQKLIVPSKALKAKKADE